MFSNKEEIEKRREQLVAELHEVDAALEKVEAEAEAKAEAADKDKQAKMEKLSELYSQISKLMSEYNTTAEEIDGDSRIAIASVDYEPPYSDEPPYDELPPPENIDEYMTNLVSNHGVYDGAPYIGLSHPGGGDGWFHSGVNC